MEIEATTTEITLTPASAPVHRAPDDSAFGIRPQTGRPHSINLFGDTRDVAQHVALRGADVLVGVGIGAALMYYLDKDRGPERRSQLSGVLQDLALTVIGRVVNRARHG